MNRIIVCVLATALAWLSGCATSERVINVPVTPATSAAAEEPQDAALPDAGASSATTDRAGMKRLTPLAGASRGVTQHDWSDRFAADDEVRVAVEDMPLSRFLHYVFGELLSVNYLIADGLTNLDAPVSLNLQESVSSRRLYTLATELLASRDIGVTYRDDVFYLHPVDRRGKSDAYVGFGARLEDVPEVPGPIMQIIPLNYGLTPSIERTIRDLVDAKVVGDPTQGALFVTGERFEILRVLDVVRLMDQPGWRGRHVGLLSLTYVNDRRIYG